MTEATEEVLETGPNRVSSSSKSKRKWGDSHDDSPDILSVCTDRLQDVGRSIDGRPHQLLRISSLEVEWRSSVQNTFYVLDGLVKRSRLSNVLNDDVLERLALEELLDVISLSSATGDRQNIGRKGECRNKWEGRSGPSLRSEPNRRR